MRFLMALSTLLALAASAAAGAAPQDTAANALLEADRAFARETTERGLAGWLDWFAPDATIFPGGQAPVTGLDSIKAHYRRTGFDPRRLRWEPSHAELATSGDLGYTWGLSEIHVPNAQGAVKVYHCKYLTVWRRQPGGAWKVAADIGAE